MAVIDLEHGYFVETDPLNHTLKHKYIGKSKDDEPKEMVRTIGYYGNMTEATTEYIKRICDSVTASYSGSIKGYAEIIDQAAENAVNGLKELWKDGVK